VKTIMTAALMLLITVPSMAAEIKGSMTCKVKYNTVISVEDGLTNIHSSYRNGLKINDKFELHYMLTGDKFRIDRFGSGLNGSIVKFHFGSLSTNAMFTSFPRMPIEILDDRFGTKLIMGPDVLKIEGPAGSLQLYRYFKSDWNALVHARSYDRIESQIYTLNCRHLIDEWQRVMAEIENKI